MIRDASDGPWCWANKAALRRITESMGEAADMACRARSVYLALCELASDAQDDSFTVTKALIAYRAGLSVRTVQRVLPDLEGASVIKVDRSNVGLKTPSTYTLLAVSAPTRHNGSSTSHNGSTIGHGAGKGQLADRVEESEESGRTEKVEMVEAGAAVAAPARISDETFPVIPDESSKSIPLPKTVGEVRAFAEAKRIPDWVADTFIKYQASKSWRMMDGRTKKLRKIFNWQKALLAFNDTNRNRQPLKQDKMANDEFWKWVDDESFDREIVGSWVRQAEKHDWMRQNKITGDMEPIFDFKASVRAWCSKYEESGSPDPW